MFEYVTDKKLLKSTYSQSANLVNQLSQRLRNDGVDARMNLVGSGLRNLVTRNGKGPFDYDFNLLIINAEALSGRELKECVRENYNEVLRQNDWMDCSDSRSVLTARPYDKSCFSTDLCIVKRDAHGKLHRLIHDKTGVTYIDQYYWNVMPDSGNLAEKEEKLKQKHWLEVRDVYLNRKNMYLRRQDPYHKSFICYIEAVNEVYYKHYGSTFPRPTNVLNVSYNGSNGVFVKEGNLILKTEYSVKLY